ncbi:hypothetical protein CCACVL1_05696 [Corchorus capsularis]|uniref:PH domain-containing protein n=1 Tax=Corchorus capsularis TaxID=210143 RepID=A0A1R3JJ93_COCAP|nr:hypothetical protein CCACVL1_05696 [Corchorus capsularis]
METDEREDEVRNWANAIRQPIKQWRGL